MNQLIHQTIMQLQPLEKTSLRDQYPQMTDRKKWVLTLDNGHYLILHDWQLIDGYTYEQLYSDRPSPADKSSITQS